MTGSLKYERAIVIFPDHGPIMNPMSKFCYFLFIHEPLLYRHPIQTVKLGTCIYFFPLCAQPGFVSFLPWEMNLGGGAVVRVDYRPLSSKPWEETCWTTSYRKTANHRPVIKIHTVNWYAASGGKPVKPVGKRTPQSLTQTEEMIFLSLKSKTTFNMTY